jgi:hypothetical protein
MRREITLEVAFLTVAIARSQCFARDHLEKCIVVGNGSATQHFPDFIVFATVWDVVW